MPIYFDNAATSHPKPPSVIRAVKRALTEANAKRQIQSAKSQARQQELKDQRSALKAELKELKNIVSFITNIDPKDLVSAPTPSEVEKEISRFF